jgi:hypothetical protein
LVTRRVVERIDRIVRCLERFFLGACLGAATGVLLVVSLGAASGWYWGTAIPPSVQRPFSWDAAEVGAGFALFIYGLPAGAAGMLIGVIVVVLRRLGKKVPPP